MLQIKKNCSIIICRRYQTSAGSPAKSQEKLTGPFHLVRSNQVAASGQAKMKFVRKHFETIGTNFKFVGLEKDVSEFMFRVVEPIYSMLLAIESRLCFCFFVFITGFDKFFCQN